MADWSFVQGLPQAPKTFGPDITEVLQAQGLQQNNQLVGSEIQGRNMLARMYQDPDALDKQTGMLKPQYVNMIGQVSPETAMDYMKNAQQFQQRQVQIQNAGIVQRQKVHEQLSNAFTPAGMAYEAVIQSGGGPQAAAEAGRNKANEIRDQELAKGWIPQAEADQLKSPNWNWNYQTWVNNQLGYKGQKTEERAGRTEERLGAASAADIQHKRIIEARGATTDPKPIEITDEEGKKTIATGVYDRDQGAWLNPDRTPIKGTVREVSTRVGEGAASEEANIATAESIAAYKAPPLSAYAMSRGNGPEIMKHLKAINPDYNAQYYRQAQRVRDAFSGSTVDARRIDSLNTTVQHLGVLEEVAKALNNHDTNAINRVMNYVGVELGRPEVTDYRVAAGIIADEVVKSVVGSGAVYDREKMTKDLSDARSPEQIQGMADKIKKLLAGQVGSMKQRWVSNRLPEEEFNDKLLPDTLEAVEKFLPKTTRKPAGTAPAVEGEVPSAAPPASAGVLPPGLPSATGVMEGTKAWDLPPGRPDRKVVAVLRGGKWVTP